MPERSLPLKVAVAGGSIGGLCAGVAFRGIGCEVDVHERTLGAMTSRGAGIVVQDDLLRLLRQHGAPELPTTSCLQRQYLLPDGGDGVVTAMPQRFTSWDAIYRTLRLTFPDERYHPGSTLTGFEQRDGRVTAHFAEWASRLAWLTSLLDPAPFLEDIPHTKIWQFAAEAHAHEIGDMRGIRGHARRHTLLLCLLQRTQAATRDELALMFLRRMRRIRKAATGCSRSKSSTGSWRRR